MNPNQRELYIANLTAYQVEMLDHMWQLDGLDEYRAWFELLDTEDQELAQGLQQLLVLAMIEEATERELRQCTEAREYLKRFRL
jgi:hypothetical protein